MQGTGNKGNPNYVYIEKMGKFAAPYGADIKSISSTSISGGNAASHIPPGMKIKGT